ncbi:acyltransferase [Shewanella sp. 0m-11]
MIRVVNLLIRKIKKDDTYQIDTVIGFCDLSYIVFNRVIALIRGFIFQVIRFRTPKLLFLGQNSKILHFSSFKFQSPLTIGKNVTIDCIGKSGVTLFGNVNIPDNTYIRCTGVISNLGCGLSVGSNTGFGHNTFINAQGGVSIGNDVIIGPNCNFLSENHGFENKGQLIREQSVSRKGINISSNVWIGANVTILDGVHIGERVVIGAGSVVTSSIPSNCVAVGIPCKVLKSI